MASNLFLLKGWTVTLIAALFALSAKDANADYFLIAYVPPFMFWVLDGYFLSQERRFRALYDHVRALNETQIDFSMDTRPFKKEARTYWDVRSAGPRASSLPLACVPGRRRLRYQEGMANAADAGTLRLLGAGCWRRAWSAHRLQVPSGAQICLAVTLVHGTSAPSLSVDVAWSDEVRRGAHAG
jgi:hypothetical protein